MRRQRTKRDRDIAVRVDSGAWVSWLISKGMSIEDVAREVARACGIRDVRCVYLIVGGVEKAYEVTKEMEVREV